MTIYGLKQAAAATGKSKPTILRAIQSHKISAQKNANGEWQIDASELHRLYPIVSGEASYEAVRSNNALQVEIEALRLRVADKDSVIDDLRRRLDTEGEERRRLLAVLTDQRASVTPSAATSPEAQKARGWWSFGKR